MGRPKRKRKALALASTSSSSKCQYQQHNDNINTPIDTTTNTDTTNHVNTQDNSTFDHVSRYERTPFGQGDSQRQKVLSAIGLSPSQGLLPNKTIGEKSSCHGSETKENSYDNPLSTRINTIYEEMMYGNVTLSSQQQNIGNTNSTRPCTRKRNKNNRRIWQKSPPQQWFDTIHIYRKDDCSYSIHHATDSTNLSPTSNDDDVHITSSVTAAGVDVASSTIHHQHISTNLKEKTDLPTTVESHQSTNNQLSKDISILRKELHELKQKLWPASERCAQAWNDYFSLHNSNFSTSAKYEFEHARNMCNPFESLGTLSVDEVMKQRYERYCTSTKDVDLNQSQTIYSNVHKDSGSIEVTGLGITIGDTSTDTQTIQRRQDESFFVCRSASKLANIDCILDFQLIKKSLRSKRNKVGSSLISSANGEHHDVTVGTGDTHDSSFIFVDLCGAPGGFSEYILHRCGMDIVKSSGRCSSSSSGSNDSQKSNNETLTQSSDDKFSATDKKNQKSSILNNRNKTSMTSLPYQGFGMSLIGSNVHGNGIEWKLDHILDLMNERQELLRYHQNIEKNDNNNTSKLDIDGIPCCPIPKSECFHIFKGVDGTGDVYNWANAVALQEEILRGKSHAHEVTDHNQNLNTDVKNEDMGSDKLDIKMVNRVDLVVADGGFDAQRDSDCQESLAHKIITCQTATSLLLLRKGGTFIMKMFGFQTDGSKMVIKRLFDSFQEVMLVKPITSRPASAERYVVCIGYIGFNGETGEVQADILLWREKVLDAHISQQESQLPTNMIVDKSMDDSACHFLDSFDSQVLYLNIEALRATVDILDTQEDTARREGKRLRYSESRVQFDSASYIQQWLI